MRLVLGLYHCIGWFAQHQITFEDTFSELRVVLSQV